MVIPVFPRGLWNAQFRKLTIKIPDSILNRSQRYRLIVGGTFSTRLPMSCWMYFDFAAPLLQYLLGVRKLEGHVTT